MRRKKRGRNLQHFLFKNSRQNPSFLPHSSSLIHMENNNTTPSAETQTPTVTVAEEKGNNNTKEVVADQSTMTSSKASKVKLITGALTIFGIILSLPLLFMFIWLLVTGTHDCESLLNLRNLQMGIATGVFILFAASNIMVFLRAKLRVMGLFLVMIPSIFMIIVGLGLVGAFNVETRTMPGSPKWLTIKVQNNYIWNEIKSCIYDTTTCQNLISKSYLLKSYDFTSSKLSPIEVLTFLLLHFHFNV